MPDTQRIRSLLARLLRRRLFLLFVLIGGAYFFSISTASALPPAPGRIPNGMVYYCGTCHQSGDAGEQHLGTSDIRRRHANNETGGRDDAVVGAKDGGAQPPDSLSAVSLHMKTRHGAVLRLALAQAVALIVESCINCPTRAVNANAWSTLCRGVSTGRT